MSNSKLRYLSEQAAETLWEGVEENLTRYTNGDFADLFEVPGWQIPFDTLEVDLEPLKELHHDKSPKAEVENSLLVWKALYSLSPSLACENRIWTRLSHCEGLEYSRARWISSGADNEELIKSVKKHFFARTQTRYRDDHAISRLWWNARIAKNIRPDDQRSALELILSKADIRSGLFERRWMFSSCNLAKGILRTMEINSEILEEKRFRRFLIKVNEFGGGKAFDLMEELEISSFLEKCITHSEASE